MLAVERVVDELRKNSKNVTTPEEIAQVKLLKLYIGAFGFLLSWH